MSMKRLFELISREQKLLVFAVVSSLIVVIAIAVRGPLVVYHFGTELFTTPLGVMSSVPQLLLTYGLIMIALATIVVRLIKMDHGARKQSKDEREVLHEHIVTEKSYRFVLYGLFLYMIVADTYVLALLILCMMVVRIKKRQFLSNV